MADGDDLKRKGAVASEGGTILWLKKEREAAWDLWVDKFVLGALDRWLEKKAKPEEEEEEEAMAPGVGEKKKKKKKKKVVKRKLSMELVSYIAAHPYTILDDISDEVLATRIPEFRQFYAITKILETKTREYRMALVAQQQKFGYAEDEDEVTDDDEEVEEMVEKENDE